MRPPLPPPWLFMYILRAISPASCTADSLLASGETLPAAALLSKSCWGGMHKSAKPRWYVGERTRRGKCEIQGKGGAYLGSLAHGHAHEVALALAAAGAAAEHLEGLHGTRTAHAVAIGLFILVVVGPPVLPHSIYTSRRQSKDASFIPAHTNTNSRGEEQDSPSSSMSSSCRRDLFWRMEPMALENISSLPESPAWRRASWCARL